MKELSIEEKAKAYNGLIERLKDLKFAFRFSPLSDTIEEIFPELKESEDEKIRKALIDLVKCNERSGYKLLNNIPTSSMIAWLEKQGESYTKKDVNDAYLKGVTNTKNEIEKQYEATYQIRKDIATFIFNYRGDIKDRAKWMDYLGIKVYLVEKQDEQNLADNVKPKFKIGDWIVYNNRIVYEIINTYKGSFSEMYTVRDTDGWLFSNSVKDIDGNSRLWTIKDAKDGDILCCDSGWTCVFKALDNHTNTFSSYCFMDKYKWFCNTGSECHTLNEAFVKVYNRNIYPAIKEQRDIFFAKMKEAGYEWDTEKKELKKIEQEPSIEGSFVNVDEVREDFIQEVYRVLDADPTNDRANQIISAFDNLPTVTIERQGK